MLLLDYNQELSLRTSPFDQNLNPTSSNKLINYDNEIESRQGVSAKVRINTLTSYESFGEGLFTMTDVKRMTSKDDFLNMPFKDRKCNIELFEDCRTRKLLEECRCTPWAVPGFQVRIHQQ